jgi:hypothetical protein
LFSVPPEVTENNGCRPSDFQAIDQPAFYSTLAGAFSQVLAAADFKSGKGFQAPAKRLRPRARGTPGSVARDDLGPVRRGPTRLRLGDEANAIDGKAAAKTSPRQMKHQTVFKRCSPAIHRSHRMRVACPPRYGMMSMRGRGMCGGLGRRAIFVRQNTGIRGARDAFFRIFPGKAGFCGLQFCSSRF